MPTHKEEEELKACALEEELKTSEEELGVGLLHAIFLSNLEGLVGWSCMGHIHRKDVTPDFI